MTEIQPNHSEPGPVTVIGPECFASADGSVICWQGVNYYREPDDDELARVFVVMDGMATEVPAEPTCFDPTHEHLSSSCEVQDAASRPPVDRCSECGASTWDPGLLRHYPGCTAGED